MKGSLLFAKFAMGIEGCYIGSASQSPLAFSANLSATPPSQLLSPEHYGRDTSLRPSASVPVFATYLKVVPHGEPVLGADAIAIPPNLAPLHLIKEDPPTPKRPKIGRAGSGGSNLLPGNYSKWGIAIGFLALAALLLFLGFLLGRIHWQKEALQFAIVIDAGSTGTRVNVYAWAHSHRDPLPVMVKPTYSRSNGSPWYVVKGQQRAYKRVETEPGLDKMLHNGTAVRNALVPLLKWAEKQIPPYAHANTELFLLATAGLRRLPSEQSEWILDNVWSVLEKSPFKCDRRSVRVISGVEEAYYGWIALNYNFGKLGHRPKLSTFGALDLGGSSFQVTFEPDEVPKHFGVNVSVGSTEHHLYAFSHAGFGLNDAFEKSVAQLLRSRGVASKRIMISKKGLMEVEHPCLHKGYRKPYVCSTHCMLPPLAYGGRSPASVGRTQAQVELKGAPNWKACQLLAESVVNTTQVTMCRMPPCALGKHQPPAHGRFYGLAGIFVLYNFFGLTASTPIEKLLEKGHKFCELNWKDAQASVVPQPSVDQYCFRAPYVVALLRHGLHLQDDQIVVGSGDFAWTLGAALWEAGALLPSQTSTSQSMLSRVTHSHSTFSLGLLMLLFLAVVAIICHLGGIVSPWRCYVFDVFHPSASASGVSMWPSSIRAQGRFGNLVGGLNDRNDGNVKMPHSPVPEVHGLHNPIFGSATSNRNFGERAGLQSGGIGALGTTTPDCLQKSGGKMHHHGNWHLQSRWTQSREDLNYCVSDLYLAKV